MSRRCEKPSQRLIQDGRGYITPLQQTEGSLAFLRQDLAALPGKPVYAQSKPRPLHQPRPAPVQQPPKRIAVSALQLMIVALLAGFVVFSLLARIGFWISPELPALENGVSPYGPRVLLTFALYAGTGLSAGSGIAYWMLRQNQL